MFYLYNLVAMHHRDIHLGKIRNYHQLYHINITNIYQFSNHNYPDANNQHYCYIHIFHKYHLVFLDCHNNYLHKHHIVYPNILLHNSIPYHLYVDLIHIDLHVYDPMQLYPGIDMVDNQFHCPTMDYHSNRQYIDHNCNRLYILDTINIDRFVDHNFVYVHCNYTVDNLGNSKILVDIDHIHDHMYLDDRHIGLLLGHNLYL